jgi:hypothetical protein
MNTWLFGEQGNIQNAESITQAFLEKIIQSQN